MVSDRSTSCWMWLVKHSGYYWIDPNGGCVDDAIKVFCNFTGPTVQTCVTPSTGQVYFVTMTTSINPCLQVDTRYWHRTSSDNWFSNIDGGFQLKYSTTENQLKFIRVGAHTAHQTFTYKYFACVCVCVFVFVCVCLCVCVCVVCLSVRPSVCLSYLRG